MTWQSLSSISPYDKAAAAAEAKAALAEKEAAKVGRCRLTLS
jgi:hypothetical protein